MAVIELHDLEQAELLAHRYGFYDLDVESSPERVSITASARNRKLTANGKTVAQAVERLFELLDG